jgi:uncharacterized membrane protein (DUF106 family)
MKETKITKTKINKKGSPVWLVILLCAVILLLYSIVSSVKHNKVIDNLNQQMQSLAEEMEKAQKEKLEKEQKLEQLKKNLVSPSATASASAEATPSAKISPDLGEKE